MLNDRERLARQQAQPFLIRLHHALSRLTSTLTVMNTGAHPDDEQSGMLAAMRFSYGMRVVIACSTRGEGGQNSLGPERGGALGVVRSRELEEAARVLDGDIAWLGHGPNDPVHDFGFSKNGVDTLARWGKDRIIERLVRAYRTERPDIVIPTFLDVPGQHGHHRAMTEAAETALALAADANAYPEHLAEGLTPWQVAKYYLPAWPGGGNTYDDELPPPPRTVAVTATARDAATGAAFAQVGEWSRAFHASQGMGFWRETPQTTWPLHLKVGASTPEMDIRDGLPADLFALGTLVGAPVGDNLREAQERIVAALAAFPHRDGVVTALLAAAEALEKAESDLGEDEFAIAGHRLARRRREIDAAILIASGVAGTAWAEPNAVSPGGKTKLHVHIEDGAAVDIAISAVASDKLEVGHSGKKNAITTVDIGVTGNAEYSNPYRTGFSSLGGNGELVVRLEAVVGGRRVGMALDLDEPLQIVPSHSVELNPQVIILRRSETPRALAVETRVEGPAAKVTLAANESFAVDHSGSVFRLTPLAEIASGRYTLPVRIDGKQAFRQTQIAYPHIGRSRFITPQAIDILALDLTLPKGVRIGYVGGGSDNVGAWLGRMGLDVTELDEAALRGDLSVYTTLVVGIFAFGLRPDLAAAIHKIHDWVRAGGHLVTLYHRPSDGWNPDATPPARLVIGSPSLRWRVTDPAAPVSVLEPDHPLIAGPNALGDADWAGWDKERGLYFASDWDAAYHSLLAINDSGEKPLKGALVSAVIDKGRHTHTALVLHHQLDKLVPGAFRIMANLVQAAS